VLPEKKGKRSKIEQTCTTLISAVRLTKSSLHASLVMLAMVAIAMLPLSNAFALTHPSTVTFSQPVLTLPYSPTLAGIAAGQQVIIATTAAHNFGDRDQDLIAFIEVRDISGITKYLAWQSGKLQVGGQMEIGVSWVPDQSGDYEIRTFAITNDWDNPQVLSEVTTSWVEIGRQEYSDNYPLQVGNKTFEVSYRFIGDAKITNMTAIAKYLTIVATVDVGEDSTLEIRLPEKMQEEFQAASGYCPGGEFVVFIDGEDKVLHHDLTGEEMILTFEVEKGSEKIEIIEDMLLSSPC
jgi:hypothetical protein